MAMQLFQKSYSRDMWPAISFTGDERSALHLVTNAVNIYDPANFPAGETLPQASCGRPVAQSTSKFLPSTAGPHFSSSPALFVHGHLCA